MTPLALKLVATLMLVAFAAAAQPVSAAERWTPGLLLRYRAIEAVALSPAGDRVAYVVREAVNEGDESR